MTFNYWQGLIKEYSDFLPITDKTPHLSLYEGNTPLIRLNNLSERYEANLYVKFEGLNPTGSFKDRGMVMAVAKAKEEGAHTIICASTGNTSASAAAYGSRIGLNTIVLIPEGKIAMGKMAQAMMYGAQIIEIQGNFDDALKIVQKIAKENTGIALVNSVNPYRLEGQKTAAFEIVDALEKAPDYVTIPVGNAGNISAYWKGFKEYHEKKGTDLPKLYGFQAEGAAPIVKGYPISHPETVATAIRIGNPASWKLAEEARDESNGIIESVTDDEILTAYERIAKTEGVFCEPGSAAAIAGMLRSLEEGKIEKGATIVAILTGNGLKDPETAIEQITQKPIILPNDEEKIVDFIHQLEQ